MQGFGAATGLMTQGFNNVFGSPTPQSDVYDQTRRMTGEFGMSQPQSEVPTSLIYMMGGQMTNQPQRGASH